MTTEQGKELAPVGGPSDSVALRPTSMGDAMRLAEIMCKGRLVPTHLQNSVSDCLMVIEQAARWGLSPFAVAQCTSVISGKLMFEGKLVAAVVNGRGELSRRLDFQYSGAGETRQVRAFATLKGEGEPREVIVKLSDVRTRNEMWVKQPDQQLAYASARVWARRHMPELMLGIYADGDDEVAGEEMGSEPYTPPPKWTAGTENAPKREIIGGFVPNDEEEYTEPVDVLDPKSGEILRREPGVTPAQNRHIHVLLREVRNQYDDETYRKHLIRSFGKEHTNLLSVSEASRVIDQLLRRKAKIQPALDAQEKERASAKEGAKPTAGFARDCPDGTCGLCLPCVTAQDEGQ